MAVPPFIRKVVEARLQSYCEDRIRHTFERKFELASTPEETLSHCSRNAPPFVINHNGAVLLWQSFVSTRMDGDYIGQIGIALASPF
jgi:hypothetical protein